MSRRRLALGVALAVSVHALAAAAQTAPELLKRAHDAFEYGDFNRTSELLKGLPDSGLLGESDRVEAWKLLGLSYFYLSRIQEADNALFGLLKQNPDFQLDPFYVPPNAVAFFDDVRKRNDPYLAPIRERRHARLKAQAEEDALRTEADRRRGLELAKPVAPLIVERQVVQNSALVAWMPFGLGQFQNDNRRLGMGLLVSESVTAAASFASYWLIEALRGDNRRFPPGVVALANRADTVKWWSAATFYLLWLAGAVEANVNFVPSKVLGELAAPPSAAPLGPLEPPRPPLPARAPDFVPARAAPPPADRAIPPSMPLPSPAAPPAPAPNADQPENVPSEAASVAASPANDPDPSAGAADEGSYVQRVEP